VNLVLWIVTGLLVVIFLVAGASKVFLPKEKLAAAPGGAWVVDFSPGTLRIIGTLEILAVVGLTLPALLDIATVLVPLAAVGLALVMVGAIIVRLRRLEGFKAVLVNVAYLAMASFVAWGRFGPEAFTS
jgi:hypothetical protein